MSDLRDVLDKLPTRAEVWGMVIAILLAFDLILLTAVSIALYYGLDSR